MNLSIDYNKVKSSLEIKNTLKKLIIGSAIILNLSPLFLKNHLNVNARLLLASSGFIFGLCCLKLPSTDYEEKLIKTYKDTALKQQKTVLGGEILKHQTQLEIKNQQELANTIERLPGYQVDYFAAKYGVTPILASNYIEENTPIENEEIPVLNVPKSIFTNVIERYENEANTELKWLKTAINSSCFIAGKKRSGKTYLMKWILSAYIEQSREIDLFYISDPHYDNIDFDDCWVSPEIDKKLIQNQRLVKSENATLSMLNDVISAGEQRKKLGLTVKKKVGLIRLFMDEIDSYSTEIQEEISQGIRKIEYEYAKYGVTCVLGCHSIKKGENGLDSSVISSMLNILFPSIVLDRNSILSGAFPSLPKIKSMMEKYKNEELPSDARLVVIADDSEVFISHVPKLDLIPIQISEDENTSTNQNEPATDQNNTNSDDINPVIRIKKWCDLCYEKYQKYPDREHIKIAWLDLTGNELSDSGLDLLIDKLGVEK
jgi:calcineurin-like phosphoesterase family protein